MRNKPAAPYPSDAPFDWETLARYLAGECSLDESESIARWLASHPADSQLLAALDNAMANLALRDASDVDVESALQRVIARRDADAAPATPALPKVIPFRRRTTSSWRLISALAAAAAIVVTARAVLLRKVSATRSPAAISSARTFTTAVGKRDSLTLPDGGRVILGPASQLTLSAGFGQRVREVELHGEAYFEVVHDTTRSFIVRVGSASVRDVGTSFGVRGDSDTRVQVVVTSGSVSLHSAESDRDATLRAGDLGLVESNGQITTRHTSSTAEYLAWMRDSLVFRDAPLSLVSAELRRWYGVTVLVTDSSLAERHLTMTFSRDPIDHVLQIIGLTLGADVDRRGDTAFVRSRARGARSQ